MNLKERRREFLNYDKKRYLQLLKNKAQENYMELLAFFKFNLLKKKNAIQ